MASVTIRYANALADVVLGNRLDVQTAVRDLNAIVTMTIESEDLRKIWENPSIAVEQKRAILDGLVGMAGTNRIIRNFVAVLIDHQRVRELPRIARQFELELNSRMGFADAEVSTVHELSAQDRQMIEQQIAKVVGKSVRARYKTNAALLGGAVIRVGSTVFDGSLKGQLA